MYKRLKFNQPKLGLNCFCPSLSGTQSNTDDTLQHRFAKHNDEPLPPPPFGQIQYIGAYNGTHFAHSASILRNLMLEYIHIYSDTYLMKNLSHLGPFFLSLLTGHQ